MPLGLYLQRVNGACFQSLAAKHSAVLRDDCSFFLIAVRTNCPPSKGCCEAVESVTCRGFGASWTEVLSESKPVKRRIAITLSNSEKLLCCKIVSKGKSALDIIC